MYLKIMERPNKSSSVDQNPILMHTRVFPLSVPFETFNVAEGHYGGMEGDPNMPEGTVGVVRYQDTFSASGYVTYYISKDQEAYVENEAGKTICSLHEDQSKQLIADFKYIAPVEQLVDEWTESSIPLSDVLNRLIGDSKLSKALFVDSLKPLLREQARRMLKL